MPLLSRFSAFWRNLFRKAHLGPELDEELRAYVELLVAEKIEQGMGEAAARRSALLDVGGVEQVKEQVRDVRIGTAVESLWRDSLTAAMKCLVFRPIIRQLVIPNAANLWVKSG